MSYLGNTPTTQSFISGTDYFNGTGAQTAFTLSRTVASVNDIQAVVNNVVQVPNDAYTISGTTITFTSAPSAGTQNVYVRYLSTTTQAITPSQNTVSWSTLDSNVQGDLGISFKNKIINGNMVIDQRNAGASVTPADGTGTYTLDRWRAYENTDGAIAVQQDSSAPTGFINSLKITVSTADSSLSASQQAKVEQYVEGLNCSDLAWGSANAKTVTFSFWVRSSVTGTFGGAFQNNGNDRSYPYTYTINAANTWEYKTVTVTGDTTGTWLTTNGIGIKVVFCIGAGTDRSGTASAWNGNNNVSATGATNLMATLNATFYITGVQLEVGTQATTFTTAGGSYGAELQLCQRYYYKWLNDSASAKYVANMQAYASGAVYGKLLDFPVPMRAIPTCSRSGDVRVDTASSASAGTATTVLLDVITRFSMASGDIKNGLSGLVAGNCAVTSMASNGYFDASAEL